MTHRNDKLSQEEFDLLSSKELIRIVGALGIESFSELSNSTYTRNDIAETLEQDVDGLDRVFNARRRIRDALASELWVDTDEEGDESDKLERKLPEFIKLPPLEQLDVFLEIIETDHYDFFADTDLESDLLSVMKKIAAGGNENLRVLLEFKRYFSFDLPNFFLVADILTTQGSEALVTLFVALKKHEQDTRLCDVLKWATKHSGLLGLNTVTEAHEICKGDEELFYGTFVEYMKLAGITTCTDLIEEKKRKDAGEPNMFDPLKRGFARIKESRGIMKKKYDENPYEQLGASSEAYGTNEALFEVFLDLIVQGVPLRIVEALSEARIAYGQSMERFKKFASLVEDKKSNARIAIEDLAKAVEVYGEDDEMFETFFTVVKRQRTCSNLIEARKVYKDDKAMFLAFAKVAEEAGNEACKSLVKVEEVYKEDPGAFPTFFEVARLGGDCLGLAVAKDQYGENEKVFSLFVRLAKERSKDHEAISEFLKAAELYEDDMKVLEAIFELTHTKGSAACRGFLDAEELYEDKKTKTGYDERKLKAVICFLGKYHYDIDVCETYRDYLLEGDESRAEAYMEGLHQRVRKMIGGDAEELRQLRLMKEYEYMLAYVFPKGNYSTYEENLKCGDHTEDLEKYQHKREGYPVELTGVKGYKVKEGAKEDRDLLVIYQDRMRSISDFIQGFPDDKEKLKLAYIQKVKAVYEERRNDLAIFEGLGEMDERDQLLALIITESVFGKTPDSTVADLIVLYKYVYEEDLQAYVQRTADEAKRQRDETSQNYILWRELSTIYGENMSHVMQHYVLTGGKKAEALRTIALAEMKKRKIEGGWKLSGKQRANIDRILSNSEISDEAKKAQLFNTLSRIYGANVDFEEHEKDRFQQEISQKVHQWLGQENANLENFIGYLHPQLLEIRESYALKIGMILCRAINQDINQIHAEISKYEPVLEVDQKETEMGGSKGKEVVKKAKKHNLRGYYAKTQETANARMGAYLCNAGENMYSNPNYFELVMGNEDTGKCEGLTMHLDIETINGKRYLWFGPNPFESLLDKVSAEACYDYLKSLAVTFAQENGFDGVVVPPRDEQILGECTNRGGMFPDLIKKSRLRHDDGTLKIVDFGGSHKLSSEYSYSSGALIWERVSTSKSY